MYCHHCGSVQRDTSRFCTNCGKPLIAGGACSAGAAVPRATPPSNPVHRPTARPPEAPTCAGCGHRMESKWTLCPYCGTPVAKIPAATEIELDAPRGLGTRRMSAEQALKPTRRDCVTSYRLAHAVATILGSNQPSGAVLGSVFAVYDGLRAVLERITLNHPIVIPYFGKFYLANHRARLGVNLATGERTMIRAKRVLKFRLSPSASVSHFDRHSTLWTRKIAGGTINVQKLSMRRRLVVDISNRAGVPLALTDVIINETLRLILRVLLDRRGGVIFHHLGTFRMFVRQEKPKAKSLWGRPVPGKTKVRFSFKASPLFNKR